MVVLAVYKRRSCLRP